MDISDFIQVLIGVCTFVLSCLVAYQEYRYKKNQKSDREHEEEIAQPSAIAAWLTGDIFASAVGVVQNSSDLPIYDVVVSAVVTKGGSTSKGEERLGYCDYRSCFAVIPPGRHSFSFDMIGFAGMCRYPVLEIAYRCADGNCWVRRGDGRLERLPVASTELYGLGLPLRYDSID